MIDEVRPALGAEVGVIAVASGDGRALRNIGFKGVDADTAAQWQEYSLESPVPMAEAARTRSPVIVRTIAERNRRYPVLAQVHGVQNGGAVICFPLLVRGELAGALGFCFDAERGFEADEMLFLQAIADQCAIAMERARWFERAQAELDARARAQNRLDAILASIDDHLVCYDREWRYTYVNDKAAQVLGRRREDLLGRSLWELFPEAVGNQYWRELHQAMREQRSIRSEHFYAPFGTWFENRIYPTPDGVTVYSCDITWRKQAEQAMGEKDRLLTLIQDNASDCLALIAVEGEAPPRFVSVNEAFMRVFGYRREQLIGRAVIESMPQPSAQALLARCAEAAAARVSVVYDEETDLPGGTRYGEVTLAPIVAGSGAVTHILCAIKDTTARKQADAALREADRRKDEFLAMLAHELRNPLAPLRTGLDILRHAEADGKMRAQVQAMMERQVGHLTHLVDDLLDVSRITEGKIELRRAPLELAAVLQSALELSRPALEAAGQHLSVEVGAEPLRLHGDITRLAQALGNLLNNAARYGRPGGRVAVTLRGEGNHALLTVEDDGEGIEPQLLPRVFDMFAQGRSSAGLGIGLTVARRMVELHGGTISAHSEGRGRGSRFVIRLPLSAAPAVARPADGSAAARPSTRALRVLIADDNADAAASMGQLLQLTGKEVRLASDGEEAVALAEAFRPHVIFLDVGMPRLDGTQAARLLRSRDWAKQAVLVALTGWGSREDMARSREAGFDHHLVKPVTLEALDRIWPA